MAAFFLLDISFFSLSFTNFGFSLRIQGCLYPIAVSLVSQSHALAFEPLLFLWVHIFSTGICSCVGVCQWPRPLL